MLCLERVLAHSSSNKLKFLAFPYGDALAHVSRVLMVAEALRARGHEVIFAASGKYTGLIEAAKFQRVEVPTLPWSEIEPVDLAGRTDYYSVDVAATHVSAERTLIQAHLPDAVISDFRPTVSTSADIEGVRHVSLLNAAWSQYYQGELIVPRAFFGGAVFHPLSKFLNRTFLQRPTQYALGRVQSAVIRKGNLAHNSVRRDLKLKPTDDLFQQWQGDLTLLADLPSYAPTKALPDNVKYVGPLVWEPKGMKLPAWWNKMEGSTGPLVYLTMGSTGDHKLIEKLVNLLLSYDLTLVVSTGGANLSLPTHKMLFVANYVPGDEIMKHAQLVICHGGNGTIYQAIRRGVPILGFPMFHDQEIYNMHQVERLGIGMRAYGLGEGRQPPRIMEQIFGIFTHHEAYASRGMKLRSEWEKFTGPELAADEIEKFLGYERFNAKR